MEDKLLEKSKRLTFRELKKIGEGLANHFENIHPQQWGNEFCFLYENTFFRKAMYKFLSNFPKEKLLSYIDDNKVEFDYRLKYIKELKEKYGKISK